MVKLTIDMVAKLGPGHNKRRPDETVEHYLNRITHMYLQEKHIEEIVS
jgi:protein phosphatase 1 regulatory subunit 42